MTMKPSGNWLWIRASLLFPKTPTSCIKVSSAGTHQRLFNWEWEIAPHDTFTSCLSVRNISSRNSSTIRMRHCWSLAKWHQLMQMSRVKLPVWWYKYSSAAQSSRSPDLKLYHKASNLTLRTQDDPQDYHRSYETRCLPIWLRSDLYASHSGFLPWTLSIKVLRCAPFGEILQ